MDIFVMRNGERLGPFSAEHVQAQIQSGYFSKSDYAWTAGLDDWKPLSDVLSGQNHAPAAPAVSLKKSKAKTPLRSKIVISFAAAFVLVGLIITLGVLGRGFRSRTSADLSPLEEAKDQQKLTPFPRPAGNDEAAKLVYQRVIYQQKALESSEFAAAHKAWMSAMEEAGLTQLHASSGADLSGKWDAALRATQAVVAKYPEFALGYDRLGDVYSHMGLIDDAIMAYQQAVKLDPTDTGSAGSWNSLGNLYRKIHENSQADYAFSKAVSLQEKRVNSQPRGEERIFSLWTLGNMFKDAGRIDEAERTYLAATDEYPRNAMAWFALAEIYVDRMELERAATAYYDGMADKRYSEAWKLVAKKLSDNGKEEYALKCYQLSEQLKARGQ